MQMKLIAIMAVGAAALVTGCASRPSAVVPLAIDASEYYHLSCREAEDRLNIARQLEATYTQRQGSAATGDALGVLLLGVPTNSVFGGNVEGQLALAKGQVRALGMAVPKICREEREAAAAAAAVPNAPPPAAAETGEGFSVNAPEQLE